ncbi:hypothetical protein [Algivirga pacifica]|uniref:Carboxypeptidase regulatory-like domain-containing protein n=1 Tax=Algivirga pacifica TaxID=1162670 RepID=A0ABP9DIA1_9BACT
MSGVVYDYEDGTPLLGATIQKINSGNNVRASKLSTINGEFQTYVDKNSEGFIIEFIGKLSIKIRNMEL